jgi:hypothetical protein
MPLKTLCAALIFTVLAAAGAETDADFKSIFDGKTLNGWETPVPSYWSVEDGAITARITKDHPCATNQYLVWTGGDLADFELKLKSRVNGEGGINNGFQFRSRLLPDHDICGYQVDNNLQTDWLVRLYDEFGRHTLAMRGERANFDLNGHRAAEKIPEVESAAWFRLEDWHEYHLICHGPDITLYVNDRLAAQVHDDDPRRRELQGILGLQLHSGPPTLAQFKEIRLKILKPAEPQPQPPQPTAKQIALRKEATGWWPLDTGGHGATPWLHHVPGWEKFELNVRAAGPSATPNGNVVLMHGAYFEAGSDIPASGKPFTLYLRARDPEGKWNGALMTKHGAFSLTADSGIALSLNTAHGIMRATFPISLIHADAWHDLVARFDGAKLTLFCDGKPMASTPVPEPAASSTSPLLIAARADGQNVGSQFEGELETAAIWSRALSGRDIAALSSQSPSPKKKREP